MPTPILQKTGTPIILANSADYAPSPANDLGTRTDQFDLTSLGVGNYRQSDKIHFGAVRAEFWSCHIVVQWTLAPQAALPVIVYLAPSWNATPGTGNAGGASGVDSPYTGYGLASTDADEAVRQLLLIGSLSTTNDVTTQVGYVGKFSPPEEYGSVIVGNASNVVFAPNAIQMSVRIVPLPIELQD